MDNAGSSAAPVAVVLLSGGLDSSFVTATADRVYKFRDSDDLDTIKIVRAK